MSKINNKVSIRLCVVMIVLGALGIICFFPFNFNSQYTCLFHRLFTEEVHSDGHDHSKNSNSVESEIGSSDSHDSNLLNRYLVPFGFFWWASIGLFTTGIYLRKKYSASKALRLKEKN